MSELRKDPILGRWIIISTERSKRPSDFDETHSEKSENGFCPFDHGNEDKTPHEILAIRKDGSLPDRPGWSLRVVPNKFPALKIEGDLNREGNGMYDKMSGIGAHEVIIETSEHSRIMSAFPIQTMKDVLWTYRERIRDLKRDRRFKYILIFKNHGAAAGASLEHTHSQLIALPIIPITVEEELHGSKDYYEYKERCIFCDMIRQEIAEKERLVTQNVDFIAFTPYASRFPFETWLLPRRHFSHYETASDDMLESLANIFLEVIGKLDRALDHPSFNFILHTSPLTSDQIDYYHWHFEIIPVLTKVAGFEWGTGFFINPTSPEQAASYLREIS
ncbi:MAG: galactose-1-phosphate uridylyltransferase [Deltaproteobacteria bacterium]|nr:galactose-1-phosphate uridylyltransferase [Deltaproteobacteria bacterium]